MARSKVRALRVTSCLSDGGRREEALPVTEEAVAIYRELAAAYPDRYRPDLARSLSNLGAWFSALGRPAEALPAEREVVEAYREPRLGELRRGETIPWRVIAAQIAPGERRGSR